MVQRRSLSMSVLLLGLMTSPIPAQDRSSRMREGHGLLGHAPRAIFDPRLPS
jgi:hypothetical protein